ncbi:MAG: GNAT family N-acetyltransferase [Clostridia bacterium]|nr:GNAT family N-acetyltransferase [Clostridia bacterium]
MIIRRLNKDENGQLDAIESTAFSFSVDIEKSGDLEREVYGAFLDDDRTLTAAVITPEYDSFYCGKTFRSVGIGGVATLPEYRRMGAIRAIFGEIFRLAPERGWVTSFLYPFSNDYYRQYGYERILCRRQVKVPISALRMFDRSTSVKLYRKDGAVTKAEPADVYNRFAARHNMMFFRDAETNAYSDKPHQSQDFTYLWYDDSEKARGLIRLRRHGAVMNVSELCYDSPEALRGLLGFLRMYEGQAEEIAFEKIPEGSELELVLSEYVGTEYSTETSAMGRILLPQVILENNRYPDERGFFRLRMDDPLDCSRGVYAVSYGNGTAEVEKLSYDADFDISLTPAPAARILFGTDNFTPDKAAYLSGVTMRNEAKDFFRAFPKRMINLYEGF